MMSGYALPRRAGTRYREPVKRWSSPYRRRRLVEADPQPTGDLMAGFLAHLGGSGRSLEYRVFDAYQQAAGDVLRARTAPDGFRGGTLFVRTPSSALAHELTMLRAEILARMETVLGPGVVTALRTRVGPLSPPSPP
jgi:hypothetical protein